MRFKRRKKAPFPVFLLSFTYKGTALLGGCVPRKGFLSHSFKFRTVWPPQGLASKSATAAQVPRDLLQRSRAEPPPGLAEGKGAGPPPPPDFSY